MNPKQKTEPKHNLKNERRHSELREQSQPRQDGRACSPISSACSPAEQLFGSIRKADDTAIAHERLLQLVDWTVPIPVEHDVHERDALGVRAHEATLPRTTRPMSRCCWQSRAPLALHATLQGAGACWAGDSERPAAPSGRASGGCCGAGVNEAPRGGRERFGRQMLKPDRPRKEEIVPSEHHQVDELVACEPQRDEHRDEHRVDALRREA
eukprot:7380429-Prymnesium_polylepis.1